MTKGECCRQGDIGRKKSSTIIAFMDSWTFTAMAGSDHGGQLSDILQEAGTYRVGVQSDSDLPTSVRKSEGFITRDLDGGRMVGSNLVDKEQHVIVHAEAIAGVKTMTIFLPWLREHNENFRNWAPTDHLDKI